MQMSEQAFWLFDLTYNMADQSEQYETRDGKWKWLSSVLFHSNSIGKVNDARYMFVEKKDVKQRGFVFGK